MKKETEKHARPAYHFTPQAHWMNDPNGLVFHEGVYHLFYQYHPYSAEWGPMHWGHASTTDLIHWQEHAVALEPDDLGMIFSGSAVLDAHNTSGLSPAGQAPLVAVFTHSLPDSAEPCRALQQQSLAYSVDAGLSWQKYAGNPVISNPGLKDFRDPKVFWHATTARWVMSLAAGDRIAFCTSPNLKDWTLQSEFGQEQGAHGGVWECPDLISLMLDGQAYWVLIVSVVPGGPNGGSATQYFVGDFDGTHFTPHDTHTRWLDHGPDNYASVTWHNTGSRTVFIGWMSNWGYAKDLPTSPWRSAMTLPRELGLQRVGEQLHLSTRPAQEVVQRLPDLPSTVASLSTDAPVPGEALRQADGRFAIELNAPSLQDFTLTLSNDAGDTLHIGYDAANRQYWIDRTQAGLSDFHTDFAARHTAPRITTTPEAQVSLFFDRSAVELFADQGLTSMTSLHFPRQPWSQLRIQAAKAMHEGTLALRVFQP